MSERSIKVAIVGAGNCAKSLAEGIALYGSNASDPRGLRRPEIGPYRVEHIDFVAAFDIDRRKVGKTLDQALCSEPNRTCPIADLPRSPVIVRRGPTLDSAPPLASGAYIQESMEPVIDVESVLRSSRAEILLNYLPTGSNQASLYYAEAALASRCSVVNCMPAALMNNSSLHARFREAGLVLLGDDVKSQCGATIVNRILLELLRLRGANVRSSRQINFGGNADHHNLQYRGEDKEHCKTASLTSVMTDSAVSPEVSMVYQEHLFDHKRAEIDLDAEIFGRIPVKLRVILEDEDSPNSAGVVVDAVRAAKLLLDCNRPEFSARLCPALMKCPPWQTSEDHAAKLFDSVIEECTQLLSA